MNIASLEVLPVRSENIPDEMKIRPQWVTWRLEERGGDLTKVPYTPGTSRKASSTDLLTWRSFEDAMRFLGRFDGIGFVLSSGDPFVAFDFDRCRNPETGGVKKDVLRFIGRFENGYVEASLSGTGVHLITCGKLRGGANIERDPGVAQDIVKKTGQTGVPVIKIGAKWIVGFDKPAIERELVRG